jgi:probable F420-dependent oxidoreductase
VRFAINLPNCAHIPALTQPWEHELGGTDIARVAKTAEELGFDAVLLPEHFLTPSSHLELTGNHYFHATTAQGFIAGATSTIKVGSMLSIFPLHHPVVTAKALATLDWFSRGRAFATLGVGWMKEEFDVLGVPFGKRGRMADEYLAAMFELWESDAPSFDGEFVSFSDIAFGPKPIQQPRPPVWIGGDADAVLRRAARFGDGWAPWLTRPEDLPARLDYLRSQPGFGDRPFSVFYSMAALNIGAGHEVVDDPDAVGSRNPQEAIDQCGRLAELGVTDTWINPPPVTDLEEYLDHMRWVATEVVPKIG